MNKRTFIKHLNNLKELHDIEGKITAAHNLLVVKGDESFPAYFILTKPIIFMTQVLKDAMNDKYNYIDYYMYDLDWGTEKIAKNCITEKDGSQVSLQTAGQLYDYIIKNNY